MKKLLTLILLTASILTASARGLVVGDVISWIDPYKPGKPPITGRVTAVSRQVGRPTYILATEFSTGETWQLWLNNKPRLIAVTN